MFWSRGASLSNANLEAIVKRKINLPLKVGHDNLEAIGMLRRQPVKLFKADPAFT